MVKVRELALKEYPAVLTYGCSAHYMSLLEKDIGNTVILKQILQNSKLFQKPSSCPWTVKRERGCMPQLPNETCWILQAACLENYKRNYKIWGENMTKISANIGLLIDNIGLYREAGNFLEQMKTFGNARRLLLSL